MPAYLLADQVDDTLKIIEVQKMLEIIKAEGAVYAQNLDAQFLQGQGGMAFAVQVDEIYNLNRMHHHLRAALSEIPAENLTQIQEFYASALGQKLLANEIAAHRAMADEDLKRKAKRSFQNLHRDSPKSINKLAAIEQNAQMIAHNVSTTLTANYHFFKGMRDGGAFDYSDDEILKESARQEDSIKKQTSDWVWTYLHLSTQGLDDANIRALVGFIKSDSGSILNGALFRGYGAMYNEMSYALGQIVALNMGTSKI